MAELNAGAPEAEEACKPCTRKTTLSGTEAAELLEDLKSAGAWDVMQDIDAGKLDVNACFTFKMKVKYGISCRCALEIFLQDTDRSRSPVFDPFEERFLTDSEDEEDDMCSHPAKEMVENGKCLCFDYRDIDEEHIKTETYSLLHVACAMGKIRCVEQLIERGCDVNMRSTYLGASPLYITLLKTREFQQKDIVEKLVKAGALLGVTDRHKCNALLVLVNTTEVSSYVTNLLLSILMKCPDFRSSLYQNGMWRTGLCGNPLVCICTDYLRYDSDKQTDIANEILTNLHTHKFLEGFLDEKYDDAKPLESVAEIGDAKALKTLMMNVEPDKIDRKEVRNALMEAVRYEKEEAVRVLLNHGVNTNLTAWLEFDQGALDFAQNISPLWAAASTGNLKIVKILVEEGGAAVNLPSGDEGNYYPLVAAAQKKNPDIAEYLLEMGAEPEFPDMIFKQTSLHAAAGAGHKKLVEKFIAMGATPDLACDSKCTPMAIALEEGHFEVAEIFVKLGANVNNIDHDSNTPLHYCGYHGNAKMMNELVKRGADINYADVTGSSCLWYAVADGDNLDTVSQILTYNPSLNVSGRGFDFKDKSRLREDMDAYTADYHYDKTKTLLSIALEQENCYIPLAKTLVCLGCPFNSDSLAETDNEEFRGWLHNFETSPQSLSDICRRNLRKVLPSGIAFHNALDTFKLPCLISNFIKASSEISE